MDERRAFSQGVGDGEDGRQGFVLDCDEGERFSGDVGVNGGYASDGVGQTADFVAFEGGVVFAVAEFGLGVIGSGEDGSDAGQLFGAAGINV